MTTHDKATEIVLRILPPGTKLSSTRLSELRETIKQQLVLLLEENNELRQHLQHLENNQPYVRWQD